MVDDPAPSIAVHVVVDAPASCTDEEKFWAEVTSRTSELRRAPPSDGTPTLVVRARRTANAAHGALSLRTARGKTLPSRDVAARTCEEVTAALALALVLAMEEGALKSEPPPPPRPERRPPPRAVPPPAPRTRPTPSPARVGTSMGAHALLVGIDGLAAGGAIFSEIRLPQWERRLSFRVEAAAWQRTVTRAEGEADLTWLTMRAGVCLGETFGIAVALCGVAEGGAFTGSTTLARNPLGYSGPWATAGLDVRATWNASPRWGIELEGGAVVPFTRDDLVLRPNVLLYRTPNVVAWGAIGPVFRFD